MNAEGWSQLVAKDRDWERSYRGRWAHDKVVRSPDPLWWPPAKVAGRYLAPYLTRDADARWGDNAGALRWLAVAEQLNVLLPPEYAEKRRLWEAAITDA